METPELNASNIVDPPAPPQPPHTPPDKQMLLRSFIILRANGWSLGHISYRLNVPKSTLCDWNLKYQADINTMRFMRMEQIRSAHSPCYEEELARLASYLRRVEAVLSERDFNDLSTPTLFYFGLHLRSRFHRLRKEAGLNPADVSSYNGCVSNQDHVLTPEAFADLPPELSPPPPASENPLRTNPDEIGGMPNSDSSAPSTCDSPSGRSSAPSSLSPT